LNAAEIGFFSTVFLLSHEGRYTVYARRWIVGQSLRNAIQMCKYSCSVTYLALGSNMGSPNGSSIATLGCALRDLAAAGVKVVAHSHLYRSTPVGSVRQPDYLNAVVGVLSTHSPAQLLRLIKGIERQAGRRSGVRWGPRPLDIDVISHRGQRLGWKGKGYFPTSGRRGQIALPHPEAHRRVFVLVPMCDIVPHWEHPVFHKPTRALIARLGPQRRGLRRVIDPAGVLWHEET
jgi:2-amino-4-hydroxy-6-hydroxymethyldihydropteridine diphosphokinase